jgi:hypothetical protein
MDPRINISNLTLILATILLKGLVIPTKPGSMPPESSIWAAIIIIMAQSTFPVMKLEAGYVHPKVLVFWTKYPV